MNVSQDAIALIIVGSMFLTAVLGLMGIIFMMTRVKIDVREATHDYPY